MTGIPVNIAFTRSRSIGHGLRREIFCALLFGCALASGPVLASEPAAPPSAAREAEPAPAPPAMPGVLVTPTRPLLPGVLPRMMPNAPPANGEAGAGCRGPVDQPLELMV